VVGVACWIESYGDIVGMEGVFVAVEACMGECVGCPKEGSVWIGEEKFRGKLDCFADAGERLDWVFQVGMGGADYPTLL
jgi:hypothetical protein